MYKSLQAGRAIAAILVVLFHLGLNIAKEKYFSIAAFSLPFSFGNAGVEFFFVLSGFIIYNAHRSDISRPPRFIRYVLKRIIRIYPVYWIVFLSVFFLAFALPTLRNTIPQDVSVIAKSLLLLPQNGTASGAIAPVIDVAWTLQYEMFFYAFFALLILNQWVGIMAGLAMLAAYFACSFSLTCSYPVTFVANTYLLLFAVGMAVSKVHASRLKIKAPLQLASIGLTSFFLVALDEVFKLNFLVDYRTLLYGLSSGLMILGLVRSEDLGKVIGGKKWLQLLGNASYALYLIHVPLISILCKILVSIGLDNFGFVGAILSWFIILSASIGSAVTFHLWIELPLVSYLRKRSSQRISAFQ